MVFALNACGGNNGATADKYNPDMKFAEVQPMSYERAYADVLNETAETFFRCKANSLMRPGDFFSPRKVIKL